MLVVPVPVVLPVVPALAPVGESPPHPNASGEVVFTTIYPGWYQGRATHIHVEVSLNGQSRKVTQIAFPEGVNDAVHRSGAYASRGTNPIANASDGIFADSLASEIVTPTGSASAGYAATFQVGIAA